MNRRVVHCMGVLLLAFFATPLSAKRSVPPDVAPLAWKGTRFVVEHWGYTAKIRQNGGYVRAIDAATGKNLWAKSVYIIDYIPGLEGDVQDIFITKIWMEKGMLLVANEKDDVFALDPRTGRQLAVGAVTSDDASAHRPVRLDFGNRKTRHYQFKE